MSRIVAAFLVALLALVVLLTHERRVDEAVITVSARETVDIGTQVVAVLDADTRVSYTERNSILGDPHVVIEQRGGRAVYRVPPDVSATIRSAGGTLEAEGGAVVVGVVEGARYASNSSHVDAHGLTYDASLLRTLDERGQDPRERLAELHAMREALRRERELDPPPAPARSR